MKVFLISLLTMLISVAVNAAPNVLKVKSYLKIDGGEKIYLNQLVDTASASQEVMAQLSQLVLGSAPALGERRVFTNKAIAQALRSQASLKQMNLIIPNQVIVENRGFELSEEAVSNELVSRWKTLCSDCEISLKQIRLPILPTELKNRPWHIEADARLPKGHFTQKLLVQQASGDNAIFWINGQIAIRKLVPVATRSLTFGQRVGDEDFRWEWRDVTQANDGVPGEKQIIGQKLRLPLQVGEILFSGMIEREKAVRRGEIVQVSTGEQTEWQVTLEAITEQDGYVGDVVNVRNRQTNKVLSAQVTAPGKVVVQ